MDCSPSRTRLLKTYRTCIREKTLETLVESFTTRLDDENWDTRLLMLNCLAAIAPALEKETLAILIRPITSRLHDPTYAVRKAALQCFTTLAPFLVEAIACRDS